MRYKIIITEMEKTLILDMLDSWESGASPLTTRVMNRLKSKITRCQNDMC